MDGSNRTQHCDQRFIVLSPNLNLKEASSQSKVQQTTNRDIVQFPKLKKMSIKMFKPKGRISLTPTQNVHSRFLIIMTTPTSGGLLASLSATSFP